MSERKVLNKYYPPDFDPSKIPKIRGPRNHTFNIRLMAPFNMRCNTCGEYIYKGKKFNSRKETVQDQTYLGLLIYRFYIKCPRCIAEIAFKTDPENTDYVLEAGATRNFEALRTAELEEMRKIKEKEEEEANNPMKLLEKRTKASQKEMNMLETLEDLRQVRMRQETLKSNLLEETLKKTNKFDDFNEEKKDVNVKRKTLSDEEEESPPVKISRVKCAESFQKTVEELKKQKMNLKTNESLKKNSFVSKLVKPRDSQEKPKDPKPSFLNIVNYSDDSDD